MSGVPSTGLGPALYLPGGAQGSFLVKFSRADNGAAIDLTGATKCEFIIKRSAFNADADAIVNKQLADFVMVDRVAGIAQLTFVSPVSAEQFGQYFYFFRATLLGGEVAIPDQLRGAFYNDPELPLTQYTNGANLVRLNSPIGTVAPISPDMANYILNRYDLTGLYGGTATKLDGLTAAVLAALANGARIQVGFAGRIVAQYKLRAIVGGEVDTPATGQIVVLDNDPTRVAELEYVWQGAMPCTWDDVAQLWCPVTGYGANVSLLPGFTIPA